MTTDNISVPDEVAESIRKTAKLRGVSDDQFAADLLSTHHEEMIQFPDGVLREGRQRLIDLLAPIPCLSQFRSSGVDFRFWWVGIELDMSSRIAWRVVRWFGTNLVSLATEMQLPVTFQPEPGESQTEPMRWVIHSTVPRLDPSDVVDWLQRHMPDSPSDEEAWLGLP